MKTMALCLLFLLSGCWRQPYDLAHDGASCVDARFPPYLRANVQCEWINNQLHIRGDVSRRMLEMRPVTGHVDVEAFDNAGKLLQAVQAQYVPKSGNIWRYNNRASFEAVICSYLPPGSTVRVTHRDANG